VTTDSTSNAAIATAYLHCPRCGLSIPLRSRLLAIVHCPRCVARDRRLVELLISGSPGVPRRSPTTLCSRQWTEPLSATGELNHEG
jgi:hypothetical protein